MIYKFRSKAGGDVIMMGPNGDQMLRLIGREPAPKGIVEPQAMPEAIARREAAAAADAAERAEQGDKPGRSGSGEERVALGPRVWPVIDMFKRAHAADVPVVWGV